MSTLAARGVCNQGGMGGMDVPPGEGVPIGVREAREVVTVRGLGSLKPGQKLPRQWG